CRWNLPYCADGNTGSGCSKRPDFSPAQPRRAKTRLIPVKAAVSEEARRYLPHFVRPFALHMILGERKNPLSVLGPSGRYPHVEPLSDARTTHGKRRVSARQGWAAEKSDFFSILPGLLDRPHPSP